MKRKSVLYFLSGVIFSALVLLSILVFYSYVPVYIENSLLPGMLRSLGIDDKTRASVRYVGVSCADFGSLVIGDPDNPTLSVDSVRLDYSIPSLIFSNHIKRLVFSGVEVNCDLEGGRASLPGSGLDLGKFMPPAAAKAGKNAKGQKGFSVGSFELRGGVLRTHHGKNVYESPFSCSFESRNSDWSSILISATMSPRGQKIKIDGDIDAKASTARVKVAAKEFRFKRFADILELFPDLSLSGRADFDASFEVSLNDFSVSSCDVDAKALNLRLNYRNMLVVENSRNNVDMETPAHLKFSKAGGKWSVELSPAAVRAPFNLHFAKLKADLERSGEGMSLAGGFALKAEKYSVEGGDFVEIERPELLNASFSGIFRDSGSWSLSLDEIGVGFPGEIIPESEKFFQMRTRSGRELSFSLPSFKMSAEGSGLSFTSETTAVLRKCALSKGRERHAAEEAVLAAKVTCDGAAGLACEASAKLAGFSFDDTKKSVAAAEAELTIVGRRDLGSGAFNFEAGLRSPETSLKCGGVFADATAGESAARLVVSGESGAGRQTAEGNFFLDMSGLSENTSGVSLASLHCEMPVKFPPPAVSAPGRLEASVLRGKSRLGELRLYPKQKNWGALFDGELGGGRIPKMTLRLDGGIGLLSEDYVEAFMKFSIPAFRIPAPMAMEGFFPGDNAALTVSGEFGADGSVYLNTAGAARSEMRLEVADATLEVPKRDFAVRNLGARLELSDLFVMRSPPSQKLSFSSLSVGRLRSSEGAVEFQVEAPGSCLVERGILKWCGGKLYTRGARISKDDKAGDFSVSCDDIVMSELFSQMGIGKAKGDARLSGNFSFKYHDGALRLKELFLGSGIGRSGNICINYNEIFTKDVPKDTSEDYAEYLEVELAQTALKEFQYDWIKMLMNFNGDDLLLRMSFEGKPLQVLPYVYKPETGRFAKAPKDNPGTEFEGVRLDLNFKYPWEKLVFKAPGEPKTLSDN